MAAEEHVAVPVVQMYELQSTMGPEPPPAPPPERPSQRVQSQRAGVPEPAFPPAPAQSTVSRLVTRQDRITRIRTEYSCCFSEATSAEWTFTWVRTPTAVPGAAQASMDGADPGSAWCVRAVSPTGERQGETRPER